MKKGRYFGDIFNNVRGLTQGDIISTILFNILIDFIFRKVERNIEENEYIKFKYFSLSYEYYGFVSGRCYSKIQKISKYFSEFFFENLGYLLIKLKLNVF